MSSGSSHSAEKSLSNAVIEAVAAEMDVLPTELPEPLYDVLNADALDTLFGDRDGTNGNVIFNYYGYLITVSANSHVSVEAETHSEG